MQGWLSLNDCFGRAPAYTLLWLCLNLGLQFFVFIIISLFFVCWLLIVYIVLWNFNLTSWLFNWVQKSVPFNLTSFLITVVFWLFHGFLFLWVAKSLPPFHFLRLFGSFYYFLCSWIVSSWYYFYSLCFCTVNAWIKKKRTKRRTWMLLGMVKDVCYR